ncbi:MAG: Ig-like domain-containing protein [Marinilabiliaceae bacterium]|nr:Ig-like domain-containing protein [Marinilabiliaceae bacterium]
MKNLVPLFILFLTISLFLSCEEEAEVSEIIVGTKTLTLCKGDIATISYLIKPYRAENKSVKFTSKDSSIAEVSTTGIVTAKAEGKTQIIVETEDGNFSETVEIRVLHGSPAEDSIALLKLYEIMYYKNWDLTKSMDKWEGVILNPNRRVLYINYDDIYIVGQIDTSIGNLSFLKSLRIYCSGWWSNFEIPAEIGLLSELEELFLYYGFSGTIPKELGNLENLKYLHLVNNYFSGSIPKELGKLTNLHSLSLYENSLSGEIPKELENLKNLSNLNLRYNYLSGDIPQYLLQRFDAYSFCPQYGEGFNNLNCY